MAATSVQIENALAGRYGGRIVRARARTMTQELVDIQDISSAIQGGAVQLDNNRATVRTCSLQILPANLPQTFDHETQYVQLFYDVYVAPAAEWVAYPLGIYQLDFPNEIYTSGGFSTWTVNGTDLMYKMLDYKDQTPVEISTGSNYITEVENLANGIGLLSSVIAFGTTTIVPFVWEAGKSFWQISADMLGGINYFPGWMSTSGIFTSRPKVNPILETTAVTYSTKTEPRMLLESMRRKQLITALPNGANVFFDGARVASFSAAVFNIDPFSPISAANRGINMVRVGNLYTPNATVALDIARQIVYDAVAKSKTMEISTLPDPRRDAHESYMVTIEDVEVSAPWRAVSWTLPLPPSTAPMVHQLSFVQDVSLGLIL